MISRSALALALLFLTATGAFAATPPVLLGDLNTIPVSQARASNAGAYVPWKDGIFFAGYHYLYGGRELFHLGPAGLSVVDIDESHGAPFALDHVFTFGVLDTGIVFQNRNYGLSTWDGVSPPRRLLPAVDSSTVVSEIIEFRGAHWFATNEGLYRTDGTAAGTVKVAKLSLAHTWARPALLGSHANALLLVGVDSGGAGVYRIDPQSGSVTLLANFKSVDQRRETLQPMNSDAGWFFAADDGIHGKEWWVTDGTTAGTRLVLDMTPGPATSYPGADQGAILNDELLVVHSSNGSGVFRVVGADGGLERLTSVNGVPAYPSFPTLVRSNGRLYFGNAGTLWMTDGTAAGTGQVSRTARPYVSGSLQPLVPVEKGVFFTGTLTTSSAIELWRSDGTDAGTFRVRVPGLAVTPGVISTPGRNLPLTDDELPLIAQVGDTVYFTGNGAGSGMEPWTYSLTDGGLSPAELNLACTSDDAIFASGISFGDAAHYSAVTGTGQRLVVVGADAGVLPTPQPAQYPLFVRSGDRIFFEATTNSGIRSQVWSYDGTTFRSHDPDPANATQDIRIIRPFEGGVVFGASLVDGGNQLFMTDGGPTVAALAGTETSLSIPSSLGVNDEGDVFFAADTSAGGTEPRIVRNGSAIDFDLAPGPTDSLIGIAAIGLPNGTFIFDVTDVHGREPFWATDSDAGLLADICPGSGSSSPAWMVRAGAEIVFSAWEPLHGRELWATDGTTQGTRLLADINPGPESSTPAHLTVSGNRVFFSASDGVHGDELFTLDLRTGIPTPVADLRSGSADSFPRDLYAIPGGVAFSADDGVFGREAYVSFGSAGMTFRLSDVAAGPASSQARYFTMAGQSLVFAADDGQIGAELYASVIDSTPPSISYSAATNDAGWITAPGTVSWTVSDLESAIVSMSGCDAGVLSESSVPHVLTCSATSIGGTSNEAFLAFVDYTPPVIACPSAIVVTSNEDGGAHVGYYLPVQDSVDLSPVLTSTPASGSFFPIGTTQVTARASDQAGHSTTCQFVITVVPATIDAGSDADAGAESDAGFGDDAGVGGDAGFSGEAGITEDAGTVDGGTPSDAGESDGGSGLDAGSSSDGGEAVDAGATLVLDAGTQEGDVSVPTTRGCGCAGVEGTPLILLAAAWLLARRRRGGAANP